MKPKRTNLVAGRLSAEGPKSKDPDSPISEGSSAHGYERLGLTSDAAQAGEGQPPQSLAEVILKLPEVRSRQPAAARPTPTKTDTPISQPDFQPDQPAPPDDQSPLAPLGRSVADLWARYKDKALLAGVGVVAVVILAAVLAPGGRTRHSPVSPQAAVGAEEANLRLIDSPKPVEVPKAEEQSTEDIPEPQTKAKVWEVLSPIDESEPLEPPPSQQQGKEIIPAAPRASAAKPSEPLKKYRQAPAGFVLAGVVKTAGGLMANINGAFVSAGGVVNGANVVEVKEYSVEMELDGEYFLLGIGGAIPPPTPRRDADTPADTKTPAQDDKKPAAPKSPSKP